MSKHRQTTIQYSLKDELFNPKKVRQLAREIKSAYPQFADKEFVKAVVDAFPEQELMERVRWIRDMLRKYLPQNYPHALAIILKALPRPLDPKKNDNDFGDFIYAPYSYYVATYGNTEKHIARSLAALREITMRFSVEGAIRDFLNSFPVETLAAVRDWSKDDNYHVRRLASEGTRPFLPWAKRIDLPAKKFLPILDVLHADQTRYVTRSVANHLNDLSKINPEMTLSLLQKWQKAKKQNGSELQFITRHALRTLIKKGHPQALALLGYKVPKITRLTFKLAAPRVKVGEALEFSVTLESGDRTAQALLIDYIIHFKKQHGGTAPKVFKLTSAVLAPGGVLSIGKRHPLKLMSTRTLYTGTHYVELQINGQSMGKKKFMLEE